MRLLFIARAFPPTLGGMETLAYRLSESIRQQADVTMLVNRRGKKALPAFLLYALCSAPLLARKNRVQVIHLADALLAPLGVVLKKVTGLPVTSTVCGLDVTYPNRFYQSAVPRALAHLNMTMPISKATEEEVRVRAGRQTPTVAIPLGVNPLPQPGPTAIQDFQRLAAIDPSQPVILSVGRLVKRKGVAWFVKQVLPRLPEHAVYVVIGEGKEMDAIRAAASTAGTAARVRLLGRVSDDILAAAYRCGDIFVMPNVPVPGDIEGFGLVALEAAASGMPVVASRLEGITDAVQHERNGLLVTPLAADEYVAKITDLLQLPQEQLRALGASFASFTQEHYGWDRTARRYLDVMREIVAPSRPPRLPTTNSE
jgi:glycosyltransferase involved in cell wall biosynthesis